MPLQPYSGHELAGDRSDTPGRLGDIYEQPQRCKDTVKVRQKLEWWRLCCDRKLAFP